MTNVAHQLAQELIQDVNGQETPDPITDLLCHSGDLELAQDGRIVGIVNQKGQDWSADLLCFSAKNPLQFFRKCICKTYRSKKMAEIALAYQKNFAQINQSLPIVEDNDLHALKINLN